MLNISKTAAGETARRQPRGKERDARCPDTAARAITRGRTLKNRPRRIDAREKFERRKRAEKHSCETCRRPPKPADAGGSGAAPFQNFPYVFVLFHNYDLFFMPYGPRLPCFRFCGLYFRGAEYKQDFRTKKSAATCTLRLIYLSEPEGPRSWLFSDPLP